MADSQPVSPEWSNDDDPKWTAAVDKPPWEARLDEKGKTVDQIKVLPCPVCTPHTISVLYDEMAAEGLRDRDGTKPSVGVECQCGYKHTSAPPDANGCGRIGYIESDPKQWRPEPHA